LQWRQSECGAGQRIQFEHNAQEDKPVVVIGIKAEQRENFGIPTNFRPAAQIPQRAKFGVFTDVDNLKFPVATAYFSVV
jgi:hypothetical protein